MADNEDISSGSIRHVAIAGVWMLDPGKLAPSLTAAFGSWPATGALSISRQAAGTNERQLVQLFVRDLEGFPDEARGRLAEFSQASAQNSRLLPTLTAGANIVLRAPRSSDPGMNWWTGSRV